MGSGVFSKASSLSSVVKCSISNIFKGELLGAGVVSAFGVGFSCSLKKTESAPSPDKTLVRDANDGKVITSMLPAELLEFGVHPQSE